MESDSCVGKASAGVAMRLAAHTAESLCSLEAQRWVAERGGVLQCSRVERKMTFACQTLQRNNQFIQVNSSVLMSVVFMNIPQEEWNALHSHSTQAWPSFVSSARNICVFVDFIRNFIFQNQFPKQRNVPKWNTFAS